MNKKTLQRIRRVLAAIFFLGVTLMFLDFTGTLHQFLAWMAKVQFMPAILALNFIVIAILLIITLLFGRIYCSVICPLGVFQDGVAHVHNWFKKDRYTFSKAHKTLRYIMLGVFIIAILHLRFDGAEPSRSRLSVVQQRAGSHQRALPELHLLP